MTLKLFCHRELCDSKAWRSIDPRKLDSKESPSDSKICDEKSGLCERVQGRILGVCNCSTREAIHDLSRKAESQARLAINAYIRAKYAKIRAMQAEKVRD